MSLNNKTIYGIFWTSFSMVINQGFNFGIGIFLARLLSPKEFGLIGMVTIFIAISEMFINSGFSQALTRKLDCTQKDFSTVFYFNLLLGIVLYLLIFIFSPYIADFYNEKSLVWIVRILGLSVVITSLTLIQKVILTRSLNFKRLNYIQTFSNLFSGIIAVYLAFTGWGVWSLVIKTILRDLLTSVLYWSLNKWRPVLTFSKKSFNELFGFSSKLLFSGIFGTIISNIQYVLIGKYISTVQLGFYTRAEMFKNLPSQNIESAITSVSYPVLAKVQNDRKKLTNGFKKLILLTFFLVAFLVTGLFAVSDTFITIVLGSKWVDSIFYLRLLCITGLMNPLLSININLPNIMGRSDLYMKYQLIAQTLMFLAALTCIPWGITVMIICLIAINLFSFYMYSLVASKFVDYKPIEQLLGLFRIMPVMILCWLPAFLFGYFYKDWDIWLICFQFASGLLFLPLLCEIMRQREYLIIKEIIFIKIFKIQ